jgi:asparagine synthase (glutamine-hydrolysing)
MCGLTGIFDVSTKGLDSLDERVKRMADRLVHRGPDSVGVWVGDGVALGHRRLSIVDLSVAGAQPMRSACGRYIMAFNGAVYNHLDIRRDLELAGAACAWRGHSDTETLLAGIAHWGLDKTRISQVTL